MDNLPQDDSDPNVTPVSKSRCHFVHKFDEQSHESEVPHRLNQKFSSYNVDKKQSNM